MLGLDDGTVVVIEESQVSCIVNNIVVWCGAGIGWSHMGGGVGHGIFAVVHEDSSIAHGGRCRICNDHGLRHPDSQELG